MVDRYVLVADDDTATRKMLWYVLTNAGFDVTIVVNGREAWEASQIMQFDLVITDHQMPHLGGGELCNLLRGSEWYADTPIILITAKGMEMDVREFQNDYNLSAVFQKPFSPTKLAEAVERLLEPHELSTAK